MYIRARAPWRSKHVAKGKDKSLTHIAKLGQVVISRLVLLVLVNPLVKVGLEEVQLLGGLEQPWPVLLLEFLLLQLHLDVLGRVVDAALGGVDLGVQLELDMVRLLKGGGGAGEGDGGGLEVELQVFFGDVGDGDGQVDEVLGGVGRRGALGPEN